MPRSVIGFIPSIPPWLRNGYFDRGWVLAADMELAFDRAAVARRLHLIRAAKTTERHTPAWRVTVEVRAPSMRRA